MNPQKQYTDKIELVIDKGKGKDDSRFPNDLQRRARHFLDNIIGVPGKYHFKRSQRGRLPKKNEGKWEIVSVSFKKPATLTVMFKQGEGKPQRYTFVEESGFGKNDGRITAVQHVVDAYNQMLERAKESAKQIVTPILSNGLISA